MTGITGVNGAIKSARSYASSLKGLHVVVSFDASPAGSAAAEVATTISPYARTVRIFDPFPERDDDSDLSDWFDLHDDDVESFIRGVRALPELAEPDFESETDEDDCPIPLDRLGSAGDARSQAIRDLAADGQIVSIVGEEGDGKSTLAWQIACEASSGDSIGAHFELAESIAPVLIVDFEQSEEDAAILRDDMLKRGLDVTGVFWLYANGRSLDVSGDREWLLRHVRELQPKMVVLDTGTEAVQSARDDESVKPLFQLMAQFMRHEGVRVVFNLLQPRKRSQDSPKGRQFDDLFGSRVWKGRSSTVLYLDRSRLVVWKQRGGYLKRRWGGEAGRVVRSDMLPTQILPPKSTEDAEAKRRSKILKAVGDAPGEYSKTSLIEEALKVSGRDRPWWRGTVDVLIREGVLRAESQHNKLKVVRPNRARTPRPPGVRPDHERRTVRRESGE